MGQKLTAYGVHMGEAEFTVDLSDGSERGAYVNQDYILRKLGRPHRAINLMYCYYPLDKGWPQRVSEVYKDADISYAWDYPYDDYFTYQGGIGGDLTKEPFVFMRDVRRHGQDVILTMTIDPHVTDEQLIAIAKDLRTFGRMQLRINHEATGEWFSFNKRCTYQEVADFYVRAHKIIKEYAPNVKTVLCIGGIEDESEDRIVKEEEFKEAVRETDIWSVDKYLALHWGWPYDFAETGGTTHARYSVKSVYELSKRSYNRFKELNGGVAKPMVMSEFNADGDVTGPFEQENMVREFVDLMQADDEKWLNAFTFYQFRDDGRLGLETTDPNNKEVGIEQPLMKMYREMIHEDYFKPKMETKEELAFPVTLRWGGSEDAEGIEMPVHLEGMPVFMDLLFDDEIVDLNLMMEFHDRWFYKAPGVKMIDLMSAFYEQPIEGPADMTIRFFAPPASGENEEGATEDWMENTYTEIKKLPELRLRYVPTEVKNDVTVL